jgi:hypothetical protein
MSEGTRVTFRSQDGRDRLMEMFTTGSRPDGRASDGTLVKFNDVTMVRDCETGQEYRLTEQLDVFTDEFGKRWNRTLE